MKPRGVAIFLLVAAALGLALASRASAGEIVRRCSITGCDPEIIFRARPGESNSFERLSENEGRTYFADSIQITLTDVSFPSGNGCRVEHSSTGRHIVSCPNAPRTVLYLGDRNDWAVGEFNGRLTIYAGPGDDTVRLSPVMNGSAVVNGEDGNDDLRGGASADLLVGGPGRDRLDGGHGPDEFSGGPGEDLADYDDWHPAVGAGRRGVRVSIGAGAGDDGGPEDGPIGHRDTVRGDVEDVRGTVHDDTLIGSDGENTLTGLDGDDLILGLDGDDTLLGGGFFRHVGSGGARYSSGGSNRLYGGLGEDTLIGGFGNDFLAGAEGNDVLRGDDATVRREGTDTLHGGPGRDLLDGGRFARDPETAKISKDRIYGEAGVDTVTYEVRSTDLLVTLDGRADDGAPGEHDFINSDVERVIGGSGNDRLVGSRFDNSLIGNGGDDFLEGALGHDDLVGGPGQDAVLYMQRTQPLQISVDDAPNDGAPNEQDNVRRSVEEVFGGSGDDLIVGNELANILHGGPGRDELRGGGGVDLLAGEEGPDLLFAADGVADLVEGGPDADCAQVDAGLDDLEFVENIFPCAAPPPTAPPTPSPTPSPTPPPPPQCSDGGDDDNDGKIDLDDPGCENASDDSESPDPNLPACSDGKDNDGDGKVDGKDPGCESAKDDNEGDPKPQSEPQCFDGKDNDGDGNVDYPNDKECGSKDDDSEGK